METNRSKTNNNANDHQSSSSPSQETMTNSSESTNNNIPLSRQVLSYGTNDSGGNRCGLLGNLENNKKGSTPQKGVINDEFSSSLSSPPAAHADSLQGSSNNNTNDEKTTSSEKRRSSSSEHNKKMTRRSSSSNSHRSNNNRNSNTTVSLPPARFSGDDETVECSSPLESSFYPLTLSLSPSVIGVVETVTTSKDDSNKDDNLDLPSRASSSSISPSLISQQTSIPPLPFNNTSTNNSLIGSLTTTSDAHPLWYLLSDMMNVSLHSLIRHVRIQRQYAFILQNSTPRAIPVGFDVASPSSASVTGSSIGCPSGDASATSARRRRRRRHLFRHSLPGPPLPHHHPSENEPLRVRGLVNEGQTCFLNAILQALASLPPLISFLAASYEESASRCWQRRHRRDELMGSLLELLVDIGGRPLEDCREERRGVVVAAPRDPMGILELVGRTHERFRRRGGGRGRMEQQDAQEFLQALMGMIVLPGGEDVGDNDTLFDYDDEGEMDETERLLSCLDWEDDDTEDLSLSLASLVQKMDEELSRVTKEKKERRRGGNDVVRKGGEKREGGYGRHDGDIDITMDIDIDMRRTAGKGKEEKKGEDFYFDNNYESSYATPDLVPENDQHTLSTMLSENQEKSSSELEQSTLGTPSPLSGWLGSHLQCASCHHIRPIQNDPFLDIPVIPTSISSFLSSNNAGIHTPPPPSAYQSPCTLQECLHHFTSMERVREVECTSCTIRSEVQSIKDEISLLENAIKSISNKQSKNSKNQQPDTTSVSELQQELLSYRYRLYHLTHVHPDSSSSIQTKTTTLTTDDNTTSSSTCSQHTYTSLISNLSSPEDSKPTQKHDADKKLLLTRPPSILCLHVQRRYYDVASQRMRKTNQHVTFPLILDMADYCAYAGSGTGVLYELRSVIEHIGDADGGHYLTYRRLTTTNVVVGGRKETEWVRVSDEKVEFVDWTVVCRCQAYMLFYEQICDS